MTFYIYISVFHTPFFQVLNIVFFKNIKKALRGYEWSLLEYPTYTARTAMVTNGLTTICTFTIIIHNIIFFST